MCRTPCSLACFRSPRSWAAEARLRRLVMRSVRRGVAPVWTTFATARFIDEGLLARHIRKLSYFAAGSIASDGVVLRYGGLATRKIEEGLKRLQRSFRRR